LLLFTLPTVAGYQRWPQANNDVTVKTLYSLLQGNRCTTDGEKQSSEVRLSNRLLHCGGLYTRDLAGVQLLSRQISCHRPSCSRPNSTPSYCSVITNVRQLPHRKAAALGSASKQRLLYPSFASEMAEDVLRPSRVLSHDDMLGDRLYC